MTTLQKNRLADHSRAQRESQQSDFTDFAETLGRPTDVGNEPQGWFLSQSVAQGVASHEALTVHSDWFGPTKLVHGPNGLIQHIAIPLPVQTPHQPGSFIGAAEAGDLEGLQRAVYRAGRRMLADPAATGRHNRVPQTVLRDIVRAAGHTVATDEQGGLRLAIGHGGFEGQTQIYCSSDRLRLVMQLGHWVNLSAAAESAMHLLATEANARTRFVRIAWLDVGKQRRCEAQVDLTGAPWVRENHPCFEPVLQRLLLIGLAGLSLAARRLGRELTVLADPANRCLVEALGEATVGVSFCENWGR